ncbi:scabin-related ADP-ribosyltransferase, partial [Ralstonia pseudosolanacearum]
LAAAGSISYDDALERLSSQALRDVDAEYAAAHPGVDMQAQAWLNQLKAENPEGFNHMPLFQATREEYKDSTLYAGTKLTNPDIYAAANRPPIPGTISPNRVNLMPLVTGNAKSLANTGIEVLNKGMAIVSGPLGPDVSMPLIPMTEEESAAATATAVMAAPFGVRGSTAAADANTAAATGRAADAANAARAGETPTWTANGGAYSQSSAGAGTPVTTVRTGPGYSAADVVPGRVSGEAANSAPNSATAADTATSSAPKSGFLFRGDGRLPGVAFNEGFVPRGTNTDLYKYASENEPSIFVPTSKSPNVAREFADMQGEGYVYTIRGQRQGLDVNAILGPRSPHPDELEIAVPGGISPFDIMGARQVGPNGTFVGPFIKNPGYR